LTFWNIGDLVIAVIVISISKCIRISRLQSCQYKLH